MSMLKIRAALESKLAAFAASKSLPVVWENIKTIPTGSYLKAFLFPANTQDPSFGNKHIRYSGMFRVTYYTTGLNAGMVPATTLVEDLVAYFPRGLQLVSGGLTTRILNTPSINSPGYEGTYMYITVEVFYMADSIE